MLSAIFISITLLSILLFFFAIGLDKRAFLLIILWIIAVGVISYSGFFTNTSAKPPRFLLVPLGVVLISIFLLKRVNKKELNFNFLLAIHILRLPVELVLYQLFLQKQVPILMTFKGWNFDILMGISAVFILLYFLISKKKLSLSFILVWNTSGLFLLANIGIIGILSAPLPIQQFAFDQPNIAVLQFPFIFLPAIVVPLVFLSHILTIKKSKDQNNSSYTNK